MWQLPSLDQVLHRRRGEGVKRADAIPALTRACAARDARLGVVGGGASLLVAGAALGSYNPGRQAGRYRMGGDMLRTDESGKSEITGADFALAFAGETGRRPAAAPASLSRPTVAPSSASSVRRKP